MTYKDDIANRILHALDSIASSLSKEYRPLPPQTIYDNPSRAYIIERAKAYTKTKEREMRDSCRISYNKNKDTFICTIDNDIEPIEATVAIKGAYNYYIYAAMALAKCLQEDLHEFHTIPEPLYPTIGAIVVMYNKKYKVIDNEALNNHDFIDNDGHSLHEKGFYGHCRLGAVQHEPGIVINDTEANY